jgi:hypothetical protein
VACVELQYAVGFTKIIKVWVFTAKRSCNKDGFCFRPASNNISPLSSALHPALSWVQTWATTSFSLFLVAPSNSVLYALKEDPLSEPLQY